MGSPFILRTLCVLAIGLLAAPAPSLANEDVRALVRAIAFEAPAAGPSENDLLASISVELGTVGGAFVAPSPLVPRVRMPLWAVGRRRGGAWLDGGALQAIVEAVAREYDRRGWRGARIDILHRDLARVTQRGADGLLVIRVSDPPPASPAR